MNTCFALFFYTVCAVLLLQDSKRAVPSVESVIGRILNGYQSFSAGYVKYDVHSERGRTLTIEEAIVCDECYFDRVIHWYSNDLYHFEDERLDPMLNSYYWSRAGRVRFYETTRTASISDGTQRFIPTVSATRYFGYLGILTPERTVDLRGKIESIGESEFNAQEFAKEHYGVSDYYFPWALADPSQWQLTPSTDRENWAILIRDSKHVSESIVVDLDLGCAIVRRQIDEAELGAGHTIQCSDFVQVTTDLWLPHRISLYSKPDKSSMQLIVRELATTVSTDYSTPNLKKPGYIVHATNAPAVVIGGGEDLLDFTVERIQRTREFQKIANQHQTVSWLLLLSAICVQLAIIWKLQKIAKR